MEKGQKLGHCVTRGWDEGQAQEEEVGCSWGPCRCPLELLPHLPKFPFPCNLEFLPPQILLEEEGHLVEGDGGLGLGGRVLERRRVLHMP